MSCQPAGTDLAHHVGVMRVPVVTIRPFPAVRSAILSVLLVMTVPVWQPDPSAQTPEPRVVEVLARRFTFEPAQIDAAIGERLRLVVRSADGVHGIEIKKFKVKKEIPRGGDAIVIEFTATEAGQFPILCSEYCGNGHDDMRGLLVVAARSEEPPPDEPTPSNKP